MAGQQPLERVAGLAGLDAVKLGFSEGGRVTRGEHQRIAFAQRHFQLFSQREQQPPAGARPTGLDEAEVPGGYSGVQREVQLAAAPPLPPLAQQRASVCVPEVGPKPTLNPPGRQHYYPTGNDHA